MRKYIRIKQTQAQVKTNIQESEARHLRVTKYTKKRKPTPEEKLPQNQTQKSIFVQELEDGELSLIPEMQQNYTSKEPVLPRQNPGQISHGLILDDNQQQLTQLTSRLD